MFHVLRRETPTNWARSRANDRFKQGWGKLFWTSLVLALLIHVGAFWLAPPFDVVVDESASELLALTPPLDVEPAPPRPVSLPPGWGILRAAGSDEIPPPPPPQLNRPPAPPPITFRDLVDGPTFTPYEIAPELKNRDEAIQALGRFYPRSRRGAGHTRLQLWFLLDRYGAVRRTLVKESSGMDDVDQAVLRAAELMEFTPAWSGDRRVPVWIALPIAFQLDTLRTVRADTAEAAVSRR